MTYSAVYGERPRGSDVGLSAVIEFEYSTKEGCGLAYGLTSVNVVTHTSMAGKRLVVYPLAYSASGLSYSN